MLPSRGWELLAGTILHTLQIKSKFKNKSIILSNIFCFIGIILILISVLFLFEDGMRHPSLLALVPIIGTCLIIFFTNNNIL